MDSTRLDAPHRCQNRSPILLLSRMPPYSFTLWIFFLARDSSRAHKWQLAYLQRNKYGPTHGWVGCRGSSANCKQSDRLFVRPILQPIFNSILYPILATPISEHPILYPILTTTLGVWCSDIHFQSRMPASVEISIKPVVCLSMLRHSSFQYNIGAPPIIER